MMKQNDRRGMASPWVIRFAGAGFVAAVAYLLGSQGVIEHEAYAVMPQDDGRMVNFRQVTPPTIVLAPNQRAIVGASDGLYYLIDYEGNSFYVKGAGRSELEWHRGPVPPASR